MTIDLRHNLPVRCTVHHSPHLTCQILSHRKNFSYRFKTLPTQNFGSAHVYTHIGTGRQANIYRLGATTVIHDRSQTGLETTMSLAKVENRVIAKLYY